MMKAYRKNGQAGFSLIEICIGLIVLGLIAAALIVPYEMYRKNKVRGHNEQNFESITAALSTYLQQNGFFPCPAQPNLSVNANNFGVENRSGAIGTACAGGGGIVSVAGVLIGDVPVSTLSLPYRMAIDPFGSKLTYAVTTALTRTATFGSGAGSVVVTVEGRAGALPPVRAQFVLASHGPDMKGARPITGGARSACGGAQDSENCNDNATFFDGNYAPQNIATNARHYDDLITYTLMRKESTMWMMRESTNGANVNGVDIYSRNQGNVGIGTAAPTGRLHVSNGNLEIVGAATGTLQATGNIQAVNDITAGQRSKAGRFRRTP